MALHRPARRAAQAGRRPDDPRARDRRYTVGLAVYPVATAVGLLNLTLFLAVMLALAVLYLLPTPDVRA